MLPNRIFRLLGGAFIVLLITGMFFTALPAFADIGWPPLNPAGASPGLRSGIDTSVRMVSEEVNLSIEPFERPAPNDWEDSPAYYMRAQVDAVFLMRNLGQVDEAFDVWFPLAASLRYKGLLPYFPDNYLRDFKLWIDGEPQEYEGVKAPDVGDPAQESMWARFPVSFPAGKDVVVRLSYILYPTGRRPFGGFEYILQTGAGWKDTIGQAKINIYLPDTITPENVSLSGRSVEGLPLQPQPEGYIIENNVIRWEFTDLEPTAEHNIFIDVLEPLRYRELIKARGLAQIRPDSADAQLELARAVRNAVMVVKTIGQHGGGLALAEQVNEAYRRAIELAPQRVQVVREYADWLMRTVGWLSLMRDAACPPELCALVEKGLRDFPGDPELTRLNEDIRLQIEENAPYATQRALDMASTAEADSANLTATQAAAELVAQQATAAALATQEVVIPAASSTPVQPSATPSPLEPERATQAAGAPASPQGGSGGLCPAGALPLAFVAALVGSIAILKREGS